MAKFKKGDRVRITTDRLADVGVPQGSYGTVDQHDNGYPWVLWNKGDSDRIWAAPEGDLTLLEKIMDNLQPGDILVHDNCKYDLEVQGNIGKAYVTLSSDDDSTWLSSARDLTDRGWRLKTDSEVTELSMSEVADKFNIPVEKLRIKKES